MTQANDVLSFYYKSYDCAVYNISFFNPEGCKLRQVQGFLSVRLKKFQKDIKNIIGFASLKSRAFKKKIYFLIFLNPDLLPNHIPTIFELCT